MKKALFIDRDGTIIREPEDEQVDSLEKLSFVPGAIGALSRLAGKGFELVLVSNQDGLGTDSFPEENFLAPHNKMLEVLAGEGVVFDAQFIDPTFPEENAPTRKPGTGMLGAYIGGGYDLGECYVIGDRATDIQLARNLGAKSVLLGDFQEYASDCVLVTRDWSKIADYILGDARKAERRRTTAETDIYVKVDLDGGDHASKIDTGLKFFDHMLAQIPHHAGIGLELTCRGDLCVDEHHTMEDVAIVLGETLLCALGDRHGIERYGFVLPMDESSAMCLLDLGGRSELVWDVPFTREYVGDTPSEMYEHFFKSLASSLKANINIKARGSNNHHLVEGVFKAFARSLRMAVRRDISSNDIPSSKMVL